MGGPHRAAPSFILEHIYVQQQRFQPTENAEGKTRLRQLSVEGSGPETNKSQKIKKGGW